MTSDFARVGDKVISMKKIEGIIKDIMELREKGYSQQEIADLLNIDRSFISRLEKIGEVRKGQDIAVIGFPILNKDELHEKLKKSGVDYVLLMTDKERNDFVGRQSGIDLFNNVMSIISKLKKYHNVISIGSDYRNKIARTLLDGRIYMIDIGQSPIKGDIYVDTDKVLEIVNMIKN